MDETIKILIIDDNPDDREAVIRLLHKSTVPRFEVAEAQCGPSGLNTLRGSGFDCVLLDFSMPGDDGLITLKEIDLRFPDVPIVMMTGLGSERVAVEALKGGAKDYLIKSELTSASITSAIDHARSEKRHEAEIIRRASFDELTGLANRRMFDERLDQSLARSGQQVVVAVLFFDLDGFKPVNDRFGHAAGDELLRQIAGRTQAILRGGDMAARMGGDEFAILLRNLPGDGKATAAAMAERLMAEIVGEPYLVGEQTLSISVSVGTAVYPLEAESRAELMRIADETMYEMKRQRRKSDALARRTEAV